jgi:hypothetical protein
MYRLTAHQDRRIQKCEDKYGNTSEIVNPNTCGKNREFANGNMYPIGENTLLRMCVNCNSRNQKSDAMDCFGPR